jgi:hypothetical protein
LRDGCESSFSGLMGRSLQEFPMGAGEPELKRRIWGSVLPRCCLFDKKMT